jgi:hypothetical protein
VQFSVQGCARFAEACQPRQASTFGSAHAISFHAELCSSLQFTGVGAWMLGVPNDHFDLICKIERADDVLSPNWD